MADDPSKIQPTPPAGGDAPGHQDLPKAPRETDDFGDPDDSDDDLDLESFGDPTRMTLGMRVVYALTIMAVIALVGYLILVILYPDRFTSREWIGATSENQTEAEIPLLKGFQMDGVYLGMTPDDVHRVHPSQRLEPASNGEQAGLFRHHEGDYRVSFRAPDWGGRAYRIQSVHYFPKVSYLELLTEVTNRYGRPAGSDCGAPGNTIAILCRLFWKMTGVKLTAEIRTSTTEAGDMARTALTITATDTRRDIAPTGSKAGKKKKRTLQDISPHK